MNIAGYGQDFTSYCKSYNELSVRIMQIAVVDFPKFVNMFLTTMFVVGLKTSEQPIIGEYVNKLFQSSVSFPAVEIIQSQLYLSMSSNQKLNDAVTGVISSNYAKRDNLRNTPGLGRSGIAGNLKPKSIQCWNCNKMGHKNYQCPEPQNTCDICEAPHHTERHQDYLATKKISDAKTLSRNTFRSQAKSNQIKSNQMLRMSKWKVL